VTQKNVQPTPIIASPVYYRIISAGNNAISTAVSTTGLNPGFYTYSPSYNTYNRIFNITNGFGRSYNILTIDKTTNATTYNIFDIFGNNTTDASLNMTSMINFLSSLTTNTNVIIATFDEPSQTGGGSIALPQRFRTALQDFGASASFGSYNQTPTPGFLNYRCAYILVGSKGLGIGNGLEKYYGNTVLNGFGNNIGDPNAVIDVRISVLNGEYTLISSSVP
jgi:hypothetical protein